MIRKISVIFKFYLPLIGYLWFKRQNFYKIQLKKYKNKIKNLIMYNSSQLFGRSGGRYRYGKSGDRKNRRGGY